jgi:PAS domain S-box-containing protein
VRNQESRPSVSTLEISEAQFNLIQDRINYLRENTDFGSALFESLIGCGIIAADFDGNIIAYNERARQIYGYAPEEIIGKQSIEIFFPKDFIGAGELENIIEELIGKERFSYEGEKVRKDSRRFPAEVLLTLIKDKNSTQGDRKCSGKEP